MSDFEAILLFIAIWIACGLIGVYGAGVLDRGSGLDEGAPLKAIFLLGPIVPIAAVVVIVMAKIWIAADKF